jgi:cyclopropane fatty-acyl-phospholipid synthase-like methyltransferase
MRVEKEDTSPMSGVEMIYDLVYSEAAERALQQIGEEAFGLYLGQTGYMTEEELRRFMRLLELRPGSRLLEIGCGGGGCSAHIASTFSAEVTGLDLSECAIRKARRLAREQGVEARTHFERTDASQPLPFAAESFDSVFSNDAMLHIARRASVLREWQRILKPGGRMLFTDAGVLTGIVSSEEVDSNSRMSSGHLVPPGTNEKLITDAGFELLRVEDLTASVEEIAGRISEGFTRHREMVTNLLGDEILAGLETHYSRKHLLAKERRLSRFMYLARKPQ